MTWNTPKPQEWKSEELSQGRIIDYKAFNFVDGEGVRNSFTSLVACFIARDAITLPPGPLRQEFPILKNLKNKS